MHHPDLYHTGLLADTIEHESDINDSTAVWDILSKDNMPIAAGNSLYHLRAPNIDEKIGRFVVIKKFAGATLINCQDIKSKRGTQFPKCFEQRAQPELFMPE